MTAVSIPSGFTSYIQNQRLPVNRVNIKKSSTTGINMALVEHAPSHGIEYGPINELVISIVLRSDHKSVTRDLGYGEVNFTDTAGQVLLTPPQQASYWRFESSPLVLHLGVSVYKAAHLFDTDVCSFVNKVNHVANLLHEDLLIGQIAHRVWAAGQQPSVGNAKLTETCLTTILALLFEQKPQNNPEASVVALAPWRLRKVMDVINSAQNNVTVAELARMIDLSTDHFSRVFKATTGRSPQQMICAVRIERAKSLLADSELSMTDLAHELGFSSSAHFSSRFRQLTGLSPTEWKLAFSNKK